MDIFTQLISHRLNQKLTFVPNLTMSLLAALPPSKNVLPFQPVEESAVSKEVVLAGVKPPPPYLRRKGFVPRKAVDFGDGGAFPEIHVAQYPLEMGRADQRKGDRTLAVSVGSDGNASYDAIVQQGGNRDRIVHTGHGALVPKVERMSKEVSLNVNLHGAWRLTRSCMGEPWPPLGH
jgi:SNW domain-containing protein 1